MTPLENLGLSIKRLQDQHHRTLDTRLTALGVSLVQWHALREIARHPESSQLRLAELTFNSAQAFGALVTRMERASLVRRTPTVGRAFALSLTPKGERLLKEGRQVVLDVLADSFGGLSDNECLALQKLVAKALHHSKTSD
ncbi:MarR family transcriptional regulator [Dyella monticola]|uniref:MarR family transcriptional regulator n=1 Tax=Dyella monticola TaxID=1927958 RepID=A0A370WU39_9GAMM|nr:MarR family transcriptional regulator [Dyella monticola]RDS79653.1 MarR family transcriptional regulator [Dyella monticola]